MGRPRTAKYPKPAELEPEEVSQEVPEEEPEVEEEEAEEPEPVAAQPSMSKADACRAALAAGIENAEEAMEFTRKKFGVEIKATDFALYKSKEKAKLAVTPTKAEPAKRGPKPKVAALAAAQPTATPKPAVNGQVDLLGALEAMKPLVAALGKEQAHRLIELLG